MENRGKSAQYQSVELCTQKNSKISVAMLSLIRAAVIVPRDSVKAVADETSIHGIKEAFNSNLFGRIFWCIMFIGCAVTMTFQLEGLFVRFYGRNVGTRTFRTANLEDVDTPAFYYCSRLWMPHPEELEKYLACTDRVLHEVRPNQTDRATRVQMIDPTTNVVQGADIEAFYEIYEKSSGCRLAYEMAVGPEVLINKILAPFNPDLLRQPSTDSGLWNERDAFQKFLETLRSAYGGSLYRYVAQTSLVNDPKQLAAGVVTEVPRNASRTFRLFLDRYTPFETVKNEFLRMDEGFGHREGEVSLTLDGVCWKITSGPGRQKIEDAMGKRTKHLVLHYGAYGYGLKSFTRRYGVPVKNFKSLLNCPPSFYESRREDRVFATYAGIASRSESPLFLEKGQFLSSDQRNVLVKYWYAKTTFLNRRNYPCKWNWTLLDQAHCNARLAGSGRYCLQYLPKSLHYSEAQVSNETCLHDHSWMADDADRLSNVQRKLLSGNDHCPHPCERETFRAEVTYVKENMLDKVLCLAAYEKLIMHREKNWVVASDWSDRHPEAFDHLNNNIKALIRVSILGSRKDNGDEPRRQGSNIPWYKEKLDILDPLPCTVIDYEQVESRRSVYEEYQLHSLAEVASNLGGTLGLWTGASVMSFVQIAYVCCLRKLLAKRARRRNATELEMV